jgi:hypothetical protein
MVIQLTRKEMHVLPVLFFAILVLFLTGTGQASEEGLFLTGIVKSIDHNSQQVVIDVKNKGCHGTKIFSIHGLSNKNMEEDGKIEFFIDSVYCPTTEVRRIVGTWRTRK